MNSSIVVSERFVLRPISSADFDLVYQLCEEPGIKRYIVGDPKGEALGEAIKIAIQASDQTFAEIGIGAWLILDRQNQTEALGFMGFIEENEPPELQLVYGLAPAARGKRVVQECGANLLRFINENLKATVPQVVACVEPENIASVRILEGLGFTRAGNSRYWSDDLGGKWIEMNRYVAKMSGYANEK
jgi:[ribosomal protein S5]-alanine N-acetyltransferase